MIPRQTYKDRCWRCGSDAASREHKYKRADVVREFGPGPYVGPDALVVGSGDKQRDVQGPSSRALKFDPSLCQSCNSAWSQPFDRAYDQFASYIRGNEVSIVRSSGFSWSAIFPGNWRTGRDNVWRYFVKHVACRLASADLQVGAGLVDFLEGALDYPQGLACELQLREDIWKLHEVLDADGIGSGSLWLGPLEAMLSATTGEARMVASHLGYRWLRFAYQYDADLPACASNFLDEHVALPVAWSVDPSDVLPA